MLMHAVCYGVRRTGRDTENPRSTNELLEVVVGWQKGEYSDAPWRTGILLRGRGLSLGAIVSHVLG
jgi:hypothetical protein